MTILAALLDENDVYLRMDELANRAALTARHVEAVTSCDLPPGKYRWIRDAANPYGGAFWPLSWIARCERDAQAVADAAAAAERVRALRAARLEEVHTQDAIDAGQVEGL